MMAVKHIPIKSIKSRNTQSFLGHAAIPNQNAPDIASATTPFEKPQIN